MVGHIGAIGAAFACFFLWKLIFSCYINPLKTLHKLRKHGFTGPKPSFPFGNLKDMKEEGDEDILNNISSFRSSASPITHDIYPTTLPYFAHWQKSYGKVFVYWRGTKPFLYVADPEFLKQMSGEVVGKNWGKSSVLRSDRDALFGKFGLNVLEGNGWVRHKNIIIRAFSSSSLRAKTNSMVECTNKLINQWKTLMAGSTEMEIDIESEIWPLAGKIMAKSNLGIDSYEEKALYDKLRVIEVFVFGDMSRVGLPFGQFISMKRTLETRRLGKEVDQLLLSIINARRKLIAVKVPQQDLLGILLEEANTNLTTRELIEECKTFFFAGYASVASAISWTLMLLALNPKWQEEIREEIKDVVGHREIDFTMLACLKKMGWVMNEVLRIYPADLNAQRQALSDIQVGKTIIPQGTNIWIDILGMHHDRTLWGDDVHEFKPERFREDPLYGGCKLKMGYLPFGFGGRMCMGRNYAIMEYKIVLSLLLSRFSFAVSPAYRHCPTSVFNFTARYGMPLIVQDLATN